MKRGSTSYVFTADVLSSSDMMKIEEVKKMVAMMNKHSFNKKRVVLRGRKPVAKAEVKDRWTGKTSVRSYDWAGNIVGGIANAAMLDVYIYDRR